MDIIAQSIVLVRPYHYYGRIPAVMRLYWLYRNTLLNSNTSTYYHQTELDWREGGVHLSGNRRSWVYSRLSLWQISVDSIMFSNVAERGYVP